MELPEGVSLAAGEKEKISAAMTELEQDVHAPREITVRFTLHVHRAYPKHVTIGKKDDGTPITTVVQNAEEEKQLSKAAKKTNGKAKESEE